MTRCYRFAYRFNIERKAEAHAVESNNASPVTATPNLYSQESIIPDLTAIEQASNPNFPVCDNSAPAHQLSSQVIPSSRNAMADSRLFISRTAPVIASMEKQWPVTY